MNLDLEDTFGALLLVALACAIGLVCTAIVADHSVRSYYLSSGSGSSSCVKAEIPWDSDETTFCSDDVNKTLDFLGKANASLVKAVK